MALCEECNVREGHKTNSGKVLCNVCLTSRNSIRERRPRPAGCG